MQEVQVEEDEKDALRRKRAAADRLARLEQREYAQLQRQEAQERAKEFLEPLLRPEVGRVGREGNVFRCMN